MRNMKYIVGSLALCLCSVLHAQDAVATRDRGEAWKQALQAGHYQALEAQLAQAQKDAQHNLAQFRGYWRSANVIVKAKPPLANELDAWVKTSASGTAHLMRAQFRIHRGWLARGEKFVSETPDQNMQRMRILMLEAQQDFNIALEKIGPACDACYAGLMASNMALGRRSANQHMIDAALHSQRGAIATPLAYIHTLHPNWGGSLDAADRFVTQFAGDYPQSAALPVLRSAQLMLQSDAHYSTTNFGQSLLLAQKAAEMDPGNSYAWERLASAALALDKKAQVLEAAGKALAIDPDIEHSLTARAAVLMAGKTPLDAVPDLERAVGLGSDWALQALLPIVAAGKYGFKPDRARAEAICKSAIDALMPSGFACMGGLNYFAIGRPADKEQARRWFVEAADKGVPSAMVDAGLMFFRGDGGPADRDKAIDYWIKGKAAGDTRAESHLQSNLGSLDYAWRVTRPAYEKAARDFLDRNGISHYLLLGLLAAALCGAIGVLLYRRGRAPG